MTSCINNRSESEPKTDLTVDNYVVFLVQSVALKPQTYTCFLVKLLMLTSFLTVFCGQNKGIGVAKRAV